MEGFNFDVSGGSGGGGNKLNKLEEVKVRLRIFYTYNEKHDIKVFNHSERGNNLLD